MRIHPLLRLVPLLAAPGAFGQEPGRAPAAGEASPPVAAAPAAAGDGAAPAGGVRAGAGASPPSGNPAAVNIVTGTGALGRLLGVDGDSGLRIGGLWIGDASGVLSGGRNPGRWGPNSLTILDLYLDAGKRLDWPGASFGTEFLQYTGRTTNGLAGAFPGFDSLDVTPPLTRQELYQLWYRQSLFGDRLIVRVGKTVPTFDFNNVVRPLPLADASAVVPAVTGLIYTPVFVNPTILGVIPGYYNSATGVTTTLAPTESVYLNYGFYDGNLAGGHQTGLSGPRFDGYYFHIGEAGYDYLAGPQRKPGNFGVGVWGQTGRLDSFAGGKTNGALGTYLFGTQRLWFRRPGEDSSGVIGFYQFGANDSDALLARRYVGGGLTAFGLVPGRPGDSFGAGLAWTWLTRGDEAGRAFFPDATGPLQVRSNQLMLQAYYQAELAKGVFFQTALTDIPNPGVSPSFGNAFAVTFRLVTLF